MCGSNPTNKVINVPASCKAAVARPPLKISDEAMCHIIAGIGNLGKDKRWKVIEREDGTDEIQITVATHQDFTEISHSVGVVRSGARNFYNAAMQKLIPGAGSRIWVSFIENVKGGITVKELVKIAKEAGKTAKTEAKEEVEVKEEQPAVTGQQPATGTF